jgi:NSS family neurotransmitter:Na+ symporter
VAVKTFGLLFFLLLLMAGLTSSVSLVEGVNCAIIDKFGWNRRRTILATSLVGVVGSVLFALPQVIDPGLAWDGTLGFTLIDLIDHWAFGYGLLIVGLIECLVLGWLLPIGRLREELNRASRFRLPAAFDWLIKLVIPAFLAYVIAASVLGEVRGFYGWHPELTGGRVLPILCFLVWLVGTLSLAGWLAFRRPADHDAARAPITTAPTTAPFEVRR